MGACTTGCAQPYLHRCATPARLNEANGNVHLLVEIAAEKVAKTAARVMRGTEVRGMATVDSEKGCLSPYHTPEIRDGIGRDGVPGDTCCQVVLRRGHVRVGLERAGSKMSLGEEGTQDRKSAESKTHTRTQRRQTEEKRSENEDGERKEKGEEVQKRKMSALITRSSSPSLGCM